MQALDVQTRASFVEHEAKLDQQREALARQHQKGLATLQAGIDSLQAKLASDANQHAVAAAELRQCNEVLRQQKDQACHKGECLDIACLGGTTDPLCEGAVHVYISHSVLAMDFVRVQLDTRICQMEKTCMFTKS